MIHALASSFPKPISRLDCRMNITDRLDRCAEAGNASKSHEVDHFDDQDLSRHPALPSEGRERRGQSRAGEGQCNGEARV
jgi:hypothetical protein